VSAEIGTPVQLQDFEGAPIAIGFPPPSTSGVATVAPLRNVRWYFLQSPESDCIEITGATRLGVYDGSNYASSSCSGSSSGGRSGSGFGSGGSGDSYNLLQFSADSLSLVVINSYLPEGGFFFRIAVSGDTIFAEVALVITLGKAGLCCVFGFELLLVILLSSCSPFRW